jgi:hypothetical protein
VTSQDDHSGLVMLADLVTSQDDHSVLVMLAEFGDQPR